MFPGTATIIVFPAAATWELAGPRTNPWHRAVVLHLQRARD